ncbi:MAG TPA: peptidylprolyl isomerase, partial [Tepidisphaeraceae bacterium]|nr:peptidylprolyl isomerase [Tepidisphaeraceae bacterium]
AFRIRLEDEIRSVSGSNKLDGEFNGGSTLSGNGTHGGDFKFKAARDTGTNQFVRMDTTFGAIKIKVRKDAAPISAGKFLDLVNTGKYDNIFVTRAIEDFVVQLGSMQIKGDGNDAHDLDENTAPEFGQELPRNLSNVRGTMSFARGGAQNNGSNQFFFNLASNTFLDTAQGNSPVFTPFAEVTSGMSVVDAMSTATKVALVNSFGTGPAGILQDDQENDLIQATGLSDVPVQTTTGLTISNVQTQSGTVKVVTGDFQPKHKLVIINRTAIQMVVTAST